MRRGICMRGSTRGGCGRRQAMRWRVMVASSTSTPRPGASRETLKERGLWKKCCRRACGDCYSWAKMVQINQEVTVYQLRVALLRTSPHVWRRLLIPSHATLADLHRTIVCAFGLEEDHPCCFRIRGRSFATSPRVGDMSGSGPHLSEFQFFLRERFAYDFHVHEAQPPAWRLEIRLEGRPG